MEVENALLSFLGVDAEQTTASISAQLLGAGIDLDRVDAMIKKLIESYFLGIEHEPGAYIYPDLGSGLVRAERKAAKLKVDPNLRHLKVHPAFHAFLEITT